MKLKFYRDFVVKFMFKERIEFMLIQYKAESGRFILKSPFDRFMTISFASISISISISTFIQISIQIQIQSNFFAPFFKFTSLKNAFENSIFSSRFQNNRWPKTEIEKVNQNENLTNEHSFHKSLSRNISNASTFFNSYINETKM